jgi:hypothetical protein
MWRNIIRCLSVVIVLAPFIRAQDAQWNNLAKVRTGTKIQVVENSLRSTSGRFVSVSGTELTMTVEGKQIVVPRERIHRVSINGKNRKRNVFIGLAIGAGVGVGIGTATRQVLNDDRIIPLETLVMAGVGAGIGAVAPASGNLYKAEAPQQTVEKTPPAAKQTTESSH